MRILYAVSCLAVMALCSPALAQADGQQAFNNSCRQCHTVEEGDNRLGPNLFGVVGRKAGTMSGYQFSAALAQSGITWDATTLDQFIANPDQVVTGHAMRPFGGISDAAQRRMIVDYLNQIK